MSDVLHHGGNSPVARMAAGLQLKNTLTSKDTNVKAQYQQRWLAFPEDVRLYIKKNVSKKTPQYHTKLNHKNVTQLFCLHFIVKNSSLEFGISSWKWSHKKSIMFNI